MSATRTIEGVVEPHGAGIVGTGEHLSMTFTLNPWRDLDGEWRERDRLFVRVPMSSLDAARRASNRYPGGTIVRLAIGKIAPASKYSLQWAAGLRPLRKIKGDTTARAVVARRAQPRTVREPILGTLTLEREVGWFSTRRMISGVNCQLSIGVTDPDDEAGVAKEIARGRALLERTERGMSAIRDRIGSELLGLYNQSWREGGPKLSRKAFLRRIELSSINIAPSRVTVYFDAGGLFTDHVVEVRIGPRGAISEVCVSG
jgi:hypothetical protein